MKKSVYLENIEAGIKRQIKWQNFDNKLARDYFIEEIIDFCWKLAAKPFKPPKSSKTRHG